METTKPKATAWGWKLAAMFVVGGIGAAIGGPIGALVGLVMFFFPD